MESHLQTQRAAIKMLHERIVMLVKYVTEVIAGKVLRRKLGFDDSERDGRRSSNQRSRHLEVVVRANGIPAGDGESRVPRGV